MIYPSAASSDAALLANALAIREDTEYLLVIAERLDAAGGLHGLWNAGSEALRPVITGSRARRLDVIIELTRRMLSPEVPPDRIDGAAAVAAYFLPRLALSRSESFWVLMLDARGYALATARIAEGTLTACLVHPREVFAPAIRARAASIIAVHNHPSGDPEPSAEDEELTERLSEAGELLGIPLLDHVIVARGGYRSLFSCGASSSREERRTQEVAGA